MSSPSVKPQSSIVYQPSPLSENASSKRYSFNPALNPRPLSILENSTMKNSPRMRAITLGSRPAPNISAILSAANKKSNVAARRHISPIPQIEEGNQMQQTPTPPQSPQTQPQIANNSFMHRTTSRTTRAPPPLQPSTTTRPNLSPLNRASLGPASTTQVQVPRPINMINRLGPIRRQTSDSLSSISPPTSPTRTNSMFSAFSRNISPGRNSISRRPIAEPQEIAVANRCLTKLLVSSQIPPPPRRIRSLTPKMMSTSIPKRPVKSQAPTGICYINELPSDILEMIFTDLTVDEILDCSLVCSSWVKPSRAAYVSVKKIFPFAGSSMLKALRATLDKIEVSSNRISDLRDDIQELAEEYCQSNPETYTAFNPLDPVDLMFNLFWFFLIVDHELRSPTTRGRITSSHFIRTIREAYPKQLVDKAALKAIYEDIKKKPLISRSIPEEPQTIELPTIQPTTTASSTSSSTTRSSPNNLSEPIRKWWRKIRRQSTEAHSGSRINYDPNIPFRNLDDTTQHRPPPRIAL